MSEKNEIDLMFEDATTEPSSNWFEFEKVGDTIGGELVESYDKEGKFGMQKIYVIKTKEGNDVNVALKHTTHKLQIQQLRAADPGDMIAFRLRELVDVGKGNPAKSIEVRIRHINK